MDIRRLGVLLFALALFGLVSLSVTALAPSSVVAQDPPEPDPAAEPAPGPPAADGAPAKPKEEKSRFWWFIRSSGLIGLLILCLSMYFVATTIRLFIELRMSVACPPEEIAQCETLLAARDFQGIYDYTSANTSFFSRLVTVGVAELPAGLPEAREVMDRTAEVETVDMERKISMLAVLGTLGPMIGLVGTLKGMISSFAVIALTDQQLKPSEVAEGISEALLLTFEGVALSVPAIYLFAVFRNRVQKISVETLLHADEFLRRLVQQARSKTGAAPTRA